MDVPITVTVGSIVLILFANFLIFMLFTYQKKNNQHIKEINSIKEAFDQEIIKTQLEIKEQTMHNISQEIHDNVGQVLSLANLQLTMIELNDNPYATRKIDNSMKLISKVISDLRDLSKTLDPGNIARIGLQESIQFDLGLMERSALLSTTFEVTGNEKKLDASKEIIIYRIVQQALNNVLKHAKATIITISMRYEQNFLKMSIIDNGDGFDTSIISSNGSRGAGLRNMINRAGLIGAAIHFESESQNGSKVLLAIPLS